jgi:hypothetical protein
MNPANTPHRGLLLSGAGFLIAFLALVTYFTLVPRWPDLRDSGLINVLAGGVGFLLSVWGVVRSVRSRRWRATSILIAALSAFLAASLPVYNYYLSYQLPDAERAIAINVSAPDFRLKDQEGRERSLSELVGKKIVLVFFRGHW